ncbi:hypothetical protein FACS1894172_20620 [Spirochaetia bacterium]|nr:hypothetical protein FACS1894172_20620 [Spirochaetia bacterium]
MEALYSVLMQKDDSVLEKVGQLLKEIEHGSIELILDSTKPFVDIIAHNRERVEVNKPKKH